MIKVVTGLVISKNIWIHKWSEWLYNWVDNEFRVNQQWLKILSDCEFFVKNKKELLLFIECMDFIVKC